MSETTPTEHEATPLADETARELGTDDDFVRTSDDPADHTDTAAAPTIPADYRPVSASDHVAPEPAVPAVAGEPGVSDDVRVREASGEPGVSDASGERDVAPEASAPRTQLADTPVEPTDSTETAAPAPAVPAPTPVAAASAEPASAERTAAYPGATYLNAPTPPRKRGNRGLGILIAVLGAVVFGVANAAATFGILSVRYGGAQARTYLTSYLEGWEFWIPLAVFLAAFIALVAIVNRGRWWAYILGSMFVAALVFAAYFAAALVTSQVWDRTPAQFRTFSGDFFLTNIPYLLVAVAATFIALEIVIWLGAWIAFHGQHAKRRYIEAKAAYDAEYGTDRAS